MRHGFRARRGGVHVFHYFFAYEQRIYGVFHQALRLRYAGDTRFIGGRYRYAARAVRQTFPRGRRGFQRQKSAVGIPEESIRDLEQMNQLTQERRGVISQEQIEEIKDPFAASKPGADLNKNFEFI